LSAQGKIRTEKAEATVDGVKFTGEVNYGMYVKGSFYPAAVWISMGPVVDQGLKDKILAALKDGAGHGYSMPPDAYIKEFVEDMQAENGRKLTRFHGGCEKCAVDYEPSPALVEKFKQALGVKADVFKAIVSTAVFLGMKWTGDWRAMGPEEAEREYEGELYCVFHGVSKFKDAEVMD
jgi:hypothetical protein